MSETEMDNKIEATLRRRLMNFDRPVGRIKISGVFTASGWKSADAWRVIERMVRSGELWHGDGAFYLLDRIAPSHGGGRSGPHISDSESLGFLLPDDVKKTRLP